MKTNDLDELMNENKACISQLELTISELNKAGLPIDQKIMNDLETARAVYETLDMQKKYEMLVSNKKINQETKIKKSHDEINSLLGIIGAVLFFVFGTSATAHEIQRLTGMEQLSAILGLFGGVMFVYPLYKLAEGTRYDLVGKKQQVATPLSITESEFDREWTSMMNDVREKAKNKI